jgi:hypothetical protein
VVLLNFDDNVTNDCRHDSYGSDGDILGGCECPVKDETNETGVETVFSRQLCEESISHALGNNDESDGNTCDDVSKQPCQVVVKDPVPEWEETTKVALDSTC